MKDSAIQLRQLLKARSWSQRDLARLLEVEPLTVWRYLEGQRKPSKKVRRKLEKKLGFKWEV